MQVKVGEGGRQNQDQIQSPPAPSNQPPEGETISRSVQGQAATGMPTITGAATNPKLKLVNMNLIIDEETGMVWFPIGKIPRSWVPESDSESDNGRLM